MEAWSDISGKPAAAGGWRACVCSLQVPALLEVGTEDFRLSYEGTGEQHQSGPFTPGKRESFN